MSQCAMHCVWWFYVMFVIEIRNFFRSFHICSPHPWACNLWRLHTEQRSKLVSCAIIFSQQNDTTYECDSKQWAHPTEKNTVSVSITEKGKSVINSKIYFCKTQSLCWISPTIPSLFLWLYMFTRNCLSLTAQIHCICSVLFCTMYFYCWC